MHLWWPPQLSGTCLCRSSPVTPRTRS
uniref:Uncharacterized protein n=1 Tax=Anguilla anguilla TaxID=7936 RepID=A0A0E9UBX4_ANGAN